MGPSSKVADPFQIWFESLLIVAIHRDPLAKGPLYFTTAHARDPLMCDPAHSKFCIVWLASGAPWLSALLLLHNNDSLQRLEPKDNIKVHNPSN